ncbi:hypothetical protein D3C72_1850320 [compost metagenome]
MRAGGMTLIRFVLVIHLGVSSPWLNRAPALTAARSGKNSSISDRVAPRVPAVRPAPPPPFRKGDTPPVPVRWQVLSQRRRTTRGDELIRWADCRSAQAWEGGISENVARMKSGSGSVGRWVSLRSTHPTKTNRAGTVRRVDSALYPPYWSEPRRLSARRTGYRE